MVLVVAIVAETVFSMTSPSVAALSLYSAMAAFSVIPNGGLAGSEPMLRSCMREN